MITSWWHHRAIDRYFAGRLGATAEARMRARLTRCPACRDHYRRSLVLEAALSGGDARAADRLWRGIQGESGRGSKSWRARSEPGWLGWLAAPRRLALAGAALGAAVILVVAMPRRRPAPARRPATGEPVVRGREDPLDLAPALHLYRSVSEHAAEPLAPGALIHASDGLLFAYTNPDPALTGLMVFAIDSAYAVHWYYPAYLRPGENPEAVPIVAGGVGIELGEEIHHLLPAGTLRLCALFLREPHRVLEIEELVRVHVAESRRPLDDGTPLPISESVQTSVILRVAP